MPDSKQGGFVNGEFYAFAKLQVTLEGNRIVAFESIEYDDGIELEEVSGANMAPLGFGEGGYNANCKLTVTKEDYDGVIAPLLGEPVYGHEPFDVACTYAKRARDAITTDSIKGLRLMKINHKSAQGDKKTMIDLEFKPLGGIWRDGKKPVETGQG